MGSEIEEMVKESLEGSNGLNEEDEDMEELEVSDDIDADEEGGEIELDLDMEDMEGDNEEDMDIDLELDVDDESDLDMEMDDIETIDLTGAEDSEVITVFKKMGPEDEIEVVQDGDSVDIKDNETGAEYRVEFGGDSEDLGMGEIDMDLDLDMDMDDEDMDMDTDEIEIDLDDMDLDMDLDMDDEDMDDDMSESVIYEIEIDEEDYMDDDMEYMDEDMDEKEEEEMEEASRTLGAGRRFGRKGLNKPKAAPRHLRQESTRGNSKLIKENKVLKNNISDLESEKEELKEDYNKLVGILKNFRTKLDEVAVFNSNLAHAVSLFTENTTTKQEKIDILKRLDSAKTIKESKSVYRQLKKEVSNKKPIKESLNDKINETKGSGSKAQISESKVYVHPEIEKMKKLWGYNYKK
jgi:hypothetical protein